MNKRLVATGLAALALLAAPRAHAQAGRLAYEDFRLENGLRVVLAPDPASPTVAVNVWYDVGARDERPGRTGFAHLFEHMMFQGSANVGKGEHFILVERAGGDLQNGTTDWDRTNYYQTFPSNRLNLGLWLEADRMRSLAVTQENFDNQREVVQEEKRQRMDNQPYVVVPLGHAHGPVQPADLLCLRTLGHRQLRRPARGAGGGRAAVLPQLLCAQQRHAHAGRRLRSRGGEGDDPPVLRRHPLRAGAAADGVHGAVQPPAPDADGGGHARAPARRDDRLRPAGPRRGGLLRPGAARTASCPRARRRGCRTGWWTRRRRPWT